MGDGASKTLACAGAGSIHLPVTESALLNITVLESSFHEPAVPWMEGQMRLARMRTIKPEFFRSATLGHFEPAARLMFIGMWTEADDHGRGLAEPKHLAGTLFPFDRGITEKRIGAWLREMAERGLIHLYETNGSRYYAVVGWWHQKVNRPKPARYPAPPGISDSTPRTKTTNHGRISDSHSPNAPPESLNGTPSGVRGQGSGPPNPRASHRKPSAEPNPGRIPEFTDDDRARTEATARAMFPERYEVAET